MQAAAGSGSRVASLVFRSVPLADPLARRRLTWGLLVLPVAAIPWLWPQRSPPPRARRDCTANFEDRWHIHPLWGWRLITGPGDAKVRFDIGVNARVRSWI